MTRSDDHHGGTRCRVLLLVALLLPALLLGGVTSSRTPVKPAYSYAMAQSPDVVVAGGLDGRVYAVNAWSGEVLWSFDSGGPMVDSSQCLGVNPATSPDMPPNYHSASARTHERAEVDVDVDGSVHVATTSSGNEQVEDRSVIQQQSASSQAMAASEAFMSQLVPSYDGRLYHFSKSKVKELGMTMADIVNLNGPVRVAVDLTNSGSEPTVDASTADILLFGEKKLEMFTLDAVSGFRRPYSSPPSKAITSEILFGRSEFTTRAVHPRNASSARCFKISEFFLDFAQQAHCSVGDGGHSMVPEILVMPKDPNSALEDEGSTIVAFDPWTSEQLWEFEVPDFDVLAVYGISTTRGATFYKWKVDGPSSTATRRTRIAAQLAGSKLENQQHRIDSSEIQDPIDREQDQHESQANKQLMQVIPRTWDTMESRFRLRMLGDNYFLESSQDDSVADENTAQSPTFHGRQADNIHDFHEEMSTHRRRRILWEPIVNDGKRGVFITYTHVGAMLLGVATCGILLAWGCYVKGLSASLAQSAIKTMDQSQFFTSHVHRLIIQRPGEEDITISSVISSSLMMNALSVDGQVPLLENGEPMNVLSTEVSANIDPATEAMLMNKFSRLAANETAAILLNGGHVGGKHKLLEGDPDADSNATTATTSSSASSLTDMIVRGVSTSSSTVRITNQGSTFASRKRLALPYAGDNSLNEEDVADIYEVKMLSVNEDAEGFVVPPADRVLDNERFELADSDDDIFFDGDDSAATLNGAKSISSSGESTTGSCCSSSDSCMDSDTKTKPNSSDAMREDETTDEKSSDAKSSLQESSEASSADSGGSTNEAEVLFPFVCQSRFVNEFEELSAIGKGGFGQVMLAENRLDGRKYAIKRVGLNLKNQTSKTLQKFLREVKILALLDHPNIVRYYQAWLEKVEESERGRSAAPSSVASDTSSFGGLAKAKNYSTSNLLAPISELEFSGNQRHLETFYSNRSLMSDNADDDGFDWDRGSTSGVDNDGGWKEEDLVVQNKPLSRNLASRVPSSRSLGDHGSGEDSSFNAAEKCDHWLYIQMQYCAGRNLGDYLAVPTRPMELSRMLKIFVQIASALAHVHSCGLIHRDLKPANIFVADVDRDEIKLGDFGLSRYAANVNLNASSSLEDSQQGPPSFNGLREAPLSSSMWSNMSESNEVTAGVGTYLYASPEQVAGKKYNAKTDIYSLGMILFELCHERFGTTMERYITLRDARDSKFPVNLRAAKRCPEILEMLRKLLSHDPTTRPTADEVVQWGQMMYETSLAQKAMDVVRSPRNLDMARAVAAHMIPPLSTCFLTLLMASASRRRGSLGDRRSFFHLCGSPIRTHKMELDYIHGKAHSPTQVRAAELPADADTPVMQRRPGKKTLKQNQRQAEADAAMAALARHLGREGGGYYDSGLRGLETPFDYDSDAPMSCVADEGSNNSMRLEGARQAGIPLYLSDWFAPNKDSNQRRRQTNVVMTRDEPESESTASDCSDSKENQFLKPHQNVDMNDVVIGRVIGEGAFGKVFKASWKGRDVAVKVLIRQNLSADVVREFETEVKIMSFLHHPNICMLLGACLTPENRALVIELVEQGSLWAILRTRRRQLTDEMRARFVLDTARGMSYLHQFELPILHRDMKSPNLLVEHDYSIKISDFGLSRVKAQIQTMTGNCGTVQWMAPEVLGNRKYTEKADVFSFGVVVWEIFTGQCPYDGMTQIQVALGVLNHDLRPPIPRSCPRFFARLIRSCWMREPSLRPSFSELVRTFEQYVAHQ